MLRLLLTCALLVAFGQASGVVWFGEDTCASDECGDSASGKDCPPNCPTCTCAPSVQTLPASRVVVDLEPPRTECPAAVFADPPLVAMPDPREILHVPKPVV